MLRNKRMVHLSFYNFQKYVKFNDGRHFHTSDCFFLRRIASSRKRYSEIRSSPEENCVAGNFESQPLTKTFSNFYGIESDEGVIHISAEKNPINPSQDSFLHKFTSKEMPEKFKNTCFGKVRLDSENKVKIHGQYEENTSVSDIGKIGNATRLKKFAISNSASNVSPSVGKTFLPSLGIQNDMNSKSDTSIQLEEVKNLTDSQLKHSEFDVKECDHEVTNDISLIDESYFPEKLLKDDEKIVSNSSISKESIYTDELKSKKVTNEIGVKFPISNANLDVKFNGSYQQENQVMSEVKASYFDELAFGSNLKNKNFVAKEKSISTISPESMFKGNKLVQTTSFSESREKTSFIDDYYFNGKLEDDLTNRDSKYAIKNMNISETSSIDNEIVNARSHNVKEKEIVCQSEPKLKVKNKENNTNFSYELDTQFSKKMSSEPELHSNNTNKFSYHDTVKEHLDPMSTTRSMPISSFKESLFNSNSRDLHKSTTNHPEMPENSEILSTKEANDQNHQPETAFDFVKKLRGEKKTMTYHEKISGFSEPVREKLDSKGFRILKYQVPELKYYTRDEMLELLVKNVLYSDDDVIVLNKPYNLVMHESKTTKEACLSKYLDDLAAELDKKSKNPKLLTVHRLDKETTGCLLLARNDISAQYLKSLFAQRKIVKTYWIVTVKVPDPLQGIIDIPITEGLIDKRSRMVLCPDLPKDVPYRNHSKRGKNAVTHYNVISESGNAALVEVKPETGIKHQIRVHFGLGLACPILGDHKYSYPDKLVPQKLQTDLLHKLNIRQSKVRYVPLHIYARSIFIPQYSEGRNLFVMAPMPIHMSKNLQRLKFKKK